MSKVIHITTKSELDQDFPSDEPYEIKIDIPALNPEELVNFIIKNKDKGNIWIRTATLSCVPDNKWLLFKKDGCTPYSCKRQVDIVVGAMAFICSLPIFLIASILVKISSSGPVIFCQSRIDNNRRTFKLFKFRTMNHLDQREEIHQDYMKKVINGHNFEQKIYKLKDDPRTTPIGKWFRRLSLDELPQLLNVLKGDMSLVGPRPPIPYEVESYKEWHFARFYAKPGLTGLWQVMGRSLIPFDEMVVLDLYYAFNQSFWLDVKILLQTIPMVLSLKGAF